MSQFSDDSHMRVWASVTVSSSGFPTLQTSFNVTSITDSGVGILTITSNLDYTSSNIGQLVSVNDNSVLNVCGIASSLAATTSIALQNRNTGGSLQDPTNWYYIAGGLQ